MSVKSNVITVSISARNEIDLLEKFIFHYSSTRVSRGRSNIALRSQLVTLLSFYFKYGYNKESKALALDSIGFMAKDLANANLDLKRAGYLVDDPDHRNVKHLIKELQVLSDLYRKRADQGQPFHLFLEFIIEP